MVSINPERLWLALDEVSAFGATPAGGLHRLAASPEDGKARDYLVAAARSMGCTIRVDAVGNTFVRRAGSDPDAPAILLGSHLDSQPQAGRYDGTYGVIAGLEVLRALDDAGAITRHPVEVVTWTNEEGARFAPAMMGSSVFAGVLTADEARATTDGDGLSLATSLDNIGFNGTAVVSPQAFLCYLELHIEQGPVLEDEGVSIGVVTGVQGMRWYRVQLDGESGHAGTYPMERRRDAMVAAAALVTEVQRIGLDFPANGRATVGRVLVTPNSPNVIPGKVELIVEFRHPDTVELDMMSARLSRACTAVAASTGVTIAEQCLLDSPTVWFNDMLTDELEAAADGLALTSRRMISGAGHDACQLSRVMPAAMLFIPCVQGVSHAEHEAISFSWAADGARALLAAVQRVDRLSKISA